MWHAQTNGMGVVESVKPLPTPFAKPQGVPPDRIYAGWENLGIINWAMTSGLPMNRVVDILIQIDVNRARLDYPV